MQIWEKLQSYQSILLFALAVAPMCERGHRPLWRKESQKKGFYILVAGDEKEPFLRNFNCLH